MSLSIGIYDEPWKTKGMRHTKRDGIKEEGQVAIKQGKEGQDSHKLRSKSHVSTQVVMGSRELVIEKRFRKDIATLGIATLATLLSTGLSFWTLGLYSTVG